MAKKNKNKAMSEPLISNAPLMDADLSAQTATAQKNANKKNKTKKSEQKPKLGARIRRSLKEMFSELKKVSWPTAKKTMSMFGIVIAVVLFFLVIISAFDYGIINLVELLMKHSVV
ncbi:MAG: preprotein translocase subunit SecE [Clostridia bacterium]|nr:preprotein translocase subunit SecE [Clostridia bacterium]